MPRAVTPTVVPDEAFSAMVLEAELLSATERALSSTSVTLMVKSLVVAELSVDVALTVIV